MQREQYKHVVLDKILDQRKKAEIRKQTRIQRELINGLYYYDVEKKSENKSLFKIIMEKLF